MGSSSAQGSAFPVIRVGAVLLGVALFVLNFESVGMAVGPSCTVGVTGTAASVTVRGWTAPAACDSLQRTSVSTYSYTGLVNAPVVCQYVVQGNRYTVNDEGILKLVGSAICASLQPLSQSSGGGVPDLSAPATPTLRAVALTPVPTPTHIVTPSPVPTTPRPTPTPRPTATPRPTPPPSPSPSQLQLGQAVQVRAVTRNLPDPPAEFAVTVLDFQLASSYRNLRGETATPPPGAKFALVLVRATNTSQVRGSSPSVGARFRESPLPLCSAPLGDRPTYASGVELYPGISREGWQCHVVQSAATGTDGDLQASAGGGSAGTEVRWVLRK